MDPLQEKVLSAFRNQQSLKREAESRTLEEAVQQGAVVFKHLRERYMAGETSDAVGTLLEREAQGEFTPMEAAYGVFDAAFRWIRESQGDPIHEHRMEQIVEDPRLVYEAAVRAGFDVDKFLEELRRES